MRLLRVLLLLMTYDYCFGAVALDACTTNTVTGTPTSITLSHTVSGSNTLAIAIGHLYHATDADGATPTSASYGAGNAMTKLDSIGSTGEGSDTSMWYIKNPATGAQTVTLNLGLAARVILAVCTFTGVDQTTSFGTVVKSAVDAIASSSSLNVSSETGGLVFDAISTLTTGGGGVLTVGAGQTQRWNLEQTDTYLYGGGSTEPGAGTVNMSWTFSGADRIFSHLAAPIKAVAAVTRKGMSTLGVGP